MSHTAWDNVPNGWPGARNTKKPSSLVVWAQAGEAIGLVYIEIKAEKWETAVYILGGLLSVFPSSPRENPSQGVMKNASCNWTCEMWNRALPPFSLQFKTQLLQKSSGLFCLRVTGTRWASECISTKEPIYIVNKHKCNIVYSIQQGKRMNQHVQKLFPFLKSHHCS